LNATINCPATPVFTPPTATDTCDPSPAIVVVSDVTTPGSCAGTYSETKTWKAVDACNNSSGTVSQTITVRDNTPPTISAAGANATINCPATPVFTPPTATDTCDPSPDIVVVSDVTTPGTCAGTYSETKTWKAVDACNNSSGTVSQTITVRDNTPPTATKGSIGACYQTVTAANQAALDATTALNDNCDASPSKAVQTSATVACSTTVVIRVSDSCGNN